MIKFNMSKKFPDKRLTKNKLQNLKGYCLPAA